MSDLITPATAVRSGGSPSATTPETAGQAQAPSTQTEHAQLQISPAPASPWRRFMACVYEGIILFGVVFFFGYGFSALTQYRGEPGALHTAFQLFMFAVLGAYFGWFWSNGRWTLPMKTIGVKLVRSTAPAPARPESIVTLPRALWRYTVASCFFWGGLALVYFSSPVVLLLWLLPFAWSIIDKRRRTLYDILSGTLLVRHDAVGGRKSRFLP